MSAGDQLFVSWEERVLSYEKGRRVVHFYLKESSANSVLAVVGTERSIRHMIYVISDHFVDAYGIVSAGTKWRARREVVEWLSELVAEFRQPSAISNSEKIELIQSLRLPEFSIAGAQSMGTNQVNQIQASRKLELLGSDVVWSGEAWICSKQLKHYPAFCRNGTAITVYSFVLIMAEEESHDLGYIEDLYEDRKGEKKAKVRWFLCNQEVKDVISQLNGTAPPGEVFITPNVKVISAECIVSVATVLSPNHYEKCLALLPEKLSSRIYMCHREFKNKKIKPFSIRKLRGYDTQATLASLDHYHDSKNKAKVRKSNEEKEDFACEDPSRRFRRRARSQREYEKPENGHSGVTNSILDNQIAKSEPIPQKLRFKLFKGQMGVKLVGSEPSEASFKDDENIEVLCQDSGISCCWFRCKILQKSQKRLKVQYHDVQDVDGPEKLEEWILASRVAAPDKLGMRCAGRVTVRPWPPQNSSDYSFEVGDAVDAWWCDGWWEGVVIGSDISGCDNLQVYLPGENKFLTFQRKDLRTSKDWIGNKWIEIKPKLDILSIISTTASPDMTFLTCSTSTEASKLDGSKFKALEDDMQKLPGSATSADLKDVEGLNLKKRLRINDVDDLVDTDFGKIRKNIIRGKAKSVLEDSFNSQPTLKRKYKQCD